MPAAPTTPVVYALELLKTPFGCGAGAGPATADWPTTSRAVTATNEAEPENSVSMPIAVALLADMGCDFFIGKLLAG